MAAISGGQLVSKTVEVNVKIKGK